MKCINVILLVVIGLLAACSRHSDLYQELKIVREIEPQSTVIDWGNMTSEERRQYPRQGFVINSEADFPDLPNINMEDLKMIDIDFKKNTLLVNYILVLGYIEGHQLRWYYDNSENKYVFQSNFKVVDRDNISELFTYYRAAIIVNKVKYDKEVSFSYRY